VFCSILHLFVFFFFFFWGGGELCFVIYPEQRGEALTGCLNILARLITLYSYSASLDVTRRVLQTLGPVTVAECTMISP